MEERTRIFCGLLTALAAAALLFACSTGSGGGDEGTISKPYVVDAREVADVSFNMHSVPGGKTFTMGEHVYETTEEVTLTDNYWMGETEVTQGLWEAVWGTTWPGDSEGEVPSSDYGVGPNKPAYYVSWYDAVAFCNKLTVADDSLDDSEQVYYSDATFDTPYTSGEEVYADLSKKGYRLPTEAEWEYAARYIDGTNWNHGNHVSGDTEYACYDYDGPWCSHDYATNERISKYAWHVGNNSGSPGDPTFGVKDVGQKVANALGLRDMSGNVYEYCHDRMDHSVFDAGRYRGGCWSFPNYDAGYNLRCALRHYDYNLADRNTGNGFRLCRTAD